jgi:hypothetical protein
MYAFIIRRPYGRVHVLHTAENSHVTVIEDNCGFSMQRFWRLCSAYGMRSYPYFSRADDNMLQIVFVVCTFVLIYDEISSDLYWQYLSEVLIVLLRLKL